VTQDLVDDDLVFDLETNGLLRELDRIWVMSIGNVRTGEVLTYTDHDRNHPPLAEGIQRLQDHLARQQHRRRCFVAHNGITFDIKALKMVTGCDIPHWSVHDTLVMGRLRNPERLGGHKLESYGIEMGVLKGAYDGGWDAYSEDMRDYCGQDSVVTIALFKKLAPVLNWGESCELEHLIAHLIDLQMENGFTLDMRASMVLAAEFAEERERLLIEMQRAFPPVYVGVETKYPKRDINYKATADRAAYSVVKDAPYTAITLQEFNPSSEFHVARRLKARYGWEAPLTEKGNPNITDKVLAKLDFPEAKLLMEFARVDKQWTQVASPPKSNGTGGGWLHHADENDRVHGYVNSNGAVTGRMTHSRPNSANIDKDARMRALWTAKPGWKLVGCDAEGLELRVLAHYLTPYDGGKLTRALLEGDKALGTDAHSMNRDNTDLYSRDGAKTLLYATLYGAGSEKAGQTWVDDWRSSGKPLEEWPAWAFMARGKQRRLKKLTSIGLEVKTRLIEGIDGFQELKGKIAEAAEKRGWVKGIDGRRIRVRHAHASLNTLLQGTGAIIMKNAKRILANDLDAKGWKHQIDYGWCADVHDEWQAEARPDIAEEFGETAKAAITKSGEHFGFRCRLDGAFDIGVNWHQTH
jgi:DNA polymerase-1